MNYTNHNPIEPFVIEAFKSTCNIKRLWSQPPVLELNTRMYVDKSARVRNSGMNGENRYILVASLKG